MNLIDFHVDTLKRLYEEKNNGITGNSLWQNNRCIDIQRLIANGYTAQFFATFLKLGDKPFLESHYDDALAIIDMFHKELNEHSDVVHIARSYKEYMENKANNKLSAFLTVEEGGIIDSKIERLDRLYNEGVRAITLTWNFENCIGYPNKDFVFKDNGLKPFGIEVLQRMDELGIIADVSHLSDGGFEDVIKYGKRPFLATHSNARAITGHNRNLTDDMLKKLADRGGMTGLNFSASFLQDEGPSTVEAMLRHLRYMINVGGLDVVGIGTDLDGIRCELEIKGAQDMPKLVEAMEKANFTTTEIEAICYKNAENFLKRYFGE